MHLCSSGRHHAFVLYTHALAFSIRGVPFPGASEGPLLRRALASRWALVAGAVRRLLSWCSPSAWRRGMWAPRAREKAGGLRSPSEPRPLIQIRPRRILCSSEPPTERAGLRQQKHPGRRPSLPRPPQPKPRRRSFFILADRHPDAREPGCAPHGVERRTGRSHCLLAVAVVAFAEGPTEGLAQSIEYHVRNVMRGNLCLSLLRKDRGPGPVHGVSRT